MHPVLRRNAALAALFAGSLSTVAGAQEGSISGTIVDPLGARVPAAAITLVQDGKAVAGTTSDAEGRFAVAPATTGRYQLAVKAGGFEPHTTRAFFAGAADKVVLDVPLQIGIQQELVVTASAMEIPASQVAAPVTVVDRATLETLAKPALLEALRLIPGSQVVQTAGRGGVTSFFVRGGASNFNKVLVDGIPVNDIGGGFNYADFSTAGVESVEALRDANSVLYGSDAMAGVASITTRRGQTRRPELSATLEGGNLSTHREEVSVGGTARRFDYFGAYSRFSTDNSVPNNAYTNDTFAGRVGLALGSAGDVSASFRRVNGDYGVPNAVDFYGIADDSSQSTRSTYVGLVAQYQLTARWHGSVRLSSFDDRSEYLNPSPTGEAFDPFGFGANYLGRTVTIRGANGTTATGRAILDYGGTYPQAYPSHAERRAVAAQTTYRVASALSVSAGGRMEHEEGSSSSSTTERDNYGSFLEARATLRRLHANAGLGYDHNAVFGDAWTPRLSAALYLREPSATDAVGDIKLVFNIGRGIKAPNMSQENSSLFKLLASAPNVKTPVEPIGPERSRGVDAGLEQGLWRGQVRLRASYFHNEYSELIEFLNKTALVRLGVPADVANATRFGAYVNSSSYRARGIETSAEASVRGFRVMASYTYLDAEVSESFSSSALSPVENPAYPGIAIGPYGALVGARPFRRPEHSGNLFVSYTKGRAQLSLSGYFAGKSDDSTFLTDPSFGSSMLLPNRDLNGGYQKIDMSAAYRLSRLKLYASAENLLDQHYTPAFGFRALPRTIRVGVTGTIGGDR